MSSIQFHAKKLMSEESTTTTGGATATPGTGEQHFSTGYKKVKGFKKGKTKDKGGFQYKELWEEDSIHIADYGDVKVYKNSDGTYFAKGGGISYNAKDKEELRVAMQRFGKKKTAGTIDDEEFKLGDSVKVVKKGDSRQWSKGKIVGNESNNNTYSVEFDEGGLENYEEADLEKEQIKEALTIEQGAKLRNLIKILSDRNDRVSIDMLNFILQKQIDPFTNMDEVKKGLDKIVQKYEGTASDESAFYNDEVKPIIAENYSRFKKETVTRSKQQQMHQAVKMVEKKLSEINRILEYTSQLKNELFEDGEGSKYAHHTNKSIDRSVSKIAEAYSKLKKIK